MPQTLSDISDEIETLEVLVTGSEAFPALERLFLGATREIWAGFRIFDLSTLLRSPEALAIGETWFDLFHRTLERGVSIKLVLTDFDPILATKYHRTSWHSARQAAILSELCEAGDLTFDVAAHPARVGWVPRIAFRKKVRERLAKNEADHLTPGLWNQSPDGPYPMVPATHHQKLAVFDREKLFIGGIDLDERRYDTLRHDRPASETWHDVQVIATGPVVKAAQRHLEEFKDVVRGRKQPSKHSKAFVRTLSAKRHVNPFHISPRTVASEIEDAHYAAIRRAEGLIYIETQYFRHLPLASTLGDIGLARPDLGLIMVLPAAPEDVAFENNRDKAAQLGEHLQTQCIDTVREGFGDRCLFCAPAQLREADGDEGGRAQLYGAPIVYVHAKVSIFGETEAIVSSANLNGRSLRWDTEAGVHLADPLKVRHLRERLFTHWMPNLTVSGGLETVDQWRTTITENARKVPAERRSFLLPYRLADARLLGAPVAGVPHELV